MNKILVDIIQDPDFPEGLAWKRRRFNLNDIIVREGDTDRNMFLVEKGALRVSGRVPLGENRHAQSALADLGAGELFGELSLFEEYPRTASVIAIEAGSLLEFDCERLSEYMEQRPEIGYKILKILFGMLSKRLGMANRRIEQLLARGFKVRRIDRRL